MLSIHDLVPQTITMGRMDISLVPAFMDINTNEVHFGMSIDDRNKPIEEKNNIIGHYTDNVTCLYNNTS